MTITKPIENPVCTVCGEKAKFLAYPRVSNKQGKRPRTLFCGHHARSKNATYNIYQLVEIKPPARGFAPDADMQNLGIQTKTWKGKRYLPKPRPPKPWEVIHNDKEAV